jgi:hypothetical protein
VGALLRLLWLEDMEYKFDERFMFDASGRIGPSQPWPWTGMTSGVGLPNPGMSIWVFVLLRKLFLADRPVELARAVVIMNVLALGCILYFAYRVVSSSEREFWLWALALVAVNPTAIQLERKIWAQSVLPVFSMLLLLGFWNRKTRWGAFLWGVLGACVGQIHMSGFFFGLGLLLWVLVWDRSEGQRLPEARWLPWLAGAVLGSLPLIPWLTHLGSLPHQAHGFSWLRPLGMNFWFLWATAPLGLHLGYSLGTSAFLDFLRTPVMKGGIPTYLCALAHSVALGAGAWIFWQAGKAVRRQLAQHPGTLRELVGIGGTPTAFVKSAGLFGFGLLLTLSTVKIFRHYLIIAYPLQYLWLAHLALPEKGGRIALSVLLSALLLLSVLFLTYIHLNHGAAHGDYGVAYQFQ